MGPRDDPKYSNFGRLNSTSRILSIELNIQDILSLWINHKGFNDLGTRIINFPQPVIPYQ